MKMVINALSARLGGGQTYLKNLLDNLPEQSDLDILVYVPVSLRLPEDLRIRRGTTRWPTENPLLRTVWEVFHLPRILAHEKAQALFCPGGVVVTRVPAGCKTVTMFRNMIPFDRHALSRMPFGLQRIRNSLLKRVMLRSMARADLTIFISNYARNIIEGLIRVANPVTIPHGIGAAFRTSGKALKRPGWLPMGEYILYVSRFDVYKHQLEVATAYCGLPSELRNQYRLLLIGEVTDDQKRHITSLAHQNGAEQQLIVVGPVPYAEIPAAYHHATANLFASSCENCPNILLEALGAGRPVLSSDVMPMPEFGADAVEYFSPFDPVSIRDAMRRVLEDESQRRRLGELAAGRSAKFDWSKTSRTTWQHILGLIAR